MYLHAWCSVMNGDKIFFVPSDFNALFCLDLGKRQVEYKGSFQGKKYEKGKYVTALSYEREICFLPYEGNQLAFYHTLTGDIRYLSLESLRGKIRDAFIEDGVLYILAYQYPDSVLKCDLVTGKCERLTERNWREVSRKIGGIPMNVSEEQEYCFQARKAGSIWWIMIQGAGILLKYEYKKDIFEVRKIKALQDCIIDDVIIGDKIWFKLRDRDVLVEYDERTEKCETFEFPGTDEVIYGTFMVDCGSRLLIVKGEGMAVFQKKERSFEFIPFHEKNICYSFEHYDNKVIIFPWLGRCILVYDPEDNVLSEYPFEWKEELNDEKLHYYFDNTLDERCCCLRDWLTAVKTHKRVCNVDETTGKSIWDAIECLP